MKYQLIIRHKGRVVFDQIGYDGLKQAIEAAAYICEQDMKANDRPQGQYSIDVKQV